MRHVHRWRQTLLAARREDCLPKMEQPDGPRIGTDAGMLTQKWRPLWVSDVLRCTGLVRQDPSHIRRNGSRGGTDALIWLESQFSEFGRVEETPGARNPATGRLIDVSANFVNRSFYRSLCLPSVVKLVCDPNR